MSELLYDLTEWCKDMTIKNFRDYIGTTDRIMYRSKQKKWINNKEWVETLNLWLDTKIRELIRYKKKAEKLLQEYK